MALRDPQLPGLCLLLDHARITAWVSRQLGEAVTLQRRHLRYKPGTSCDLYVEATTAAGSNRPATPSLLLSAYALDDQAKAVKTRERAPSGAVLGAAPELGVLLCTPAADRDLPALSRLFDEPGRQRLYQRLLGTGEFGGVAPAPRSLRYKPHRRWVGLWDGPDGTPVLVRAYRRDAVRPAASVLAALQAAGGHTPRLLQLDRRRAVAAVEFVPGRPVDRAGGAGHSGYADTSTFHRTGEALARLHRLPAIRMQESLPARPLRAEASAVRAAAGQLGTVLPDLARPADELAGRIAAGLCRLPERRTPVHGDFSADQAVVGDDGTVRLVDLDSAGLGDPSADLGCAAAAMACAVVLGTLTGAGRAERLAALHAGYREAGCQIDEERLRWHEAAQLLRRAEEPFRLGLTEDWPTTANELVRWAESTVSELAR